MKIKERVNSDKFYKTNPMGISLIVLVITIVVIIILATAIIISVIDNNPLSEANKARFQSDRDNMQSIFTNTVAKVMAVNQGSIKIKASELNEIKNGVSNTVGVASYSLENPVNESNKNGIIIFDNSSNTQTEYYTGKRLPIYKAGETIWYVDQEGIISLKVGNQSYGDIETIKKEDKTLCITEEEYNELLLKSQELISKSQELAAKSQELELAKKEIEELKNKKEIPEGYVRPSGTIKLTEKKANIDVNNYQYADTTSLYTLSEVQTGKGIYWNAGVTTMQNRNNLGYFEINFGFKPSNAIIFIENNNGSGVCTFNIMGDTVRNAGFYGNDKNNTWYSTYNANEIFQINNTTYIYNRSSTFIGATIRWIAYK